MNFVWIFLWTFLIAIVGYNSKQIERVCGETTYRYQYIWVVVALIPLVWMVATRTDVFGDTIVYRNNFINMPSSFDSIMQYLNTIKKDKGFYALSAVLRCLIGNHDKVYFAILAVFQGGIVYSVYRKYSTNYWISIFLFLASTDYVGWMYNGIRQFTAVVIVFAATHFIVEKKYLPAIMMILLASTMHQSALIMIPIIFIVQGKAWNSKTMIVLVLMILAMVYVDKFTVFMSTALEETQYTNVVADYVSFNDDGTNPIRVLVYSLPAILSFVFKKWIDAKNNKFINMCVNMSIITMGIYLVSMVTSGIFLGRLPIYTSL